MSTQSHLSELERRHATLKKQIEGEALSPSVDSLELAELKRRKLVLKDQIARLKDETRH